MSRALLVIDVQREYFDGALPISHPVGHLESILQVMDDATKYHVPTAVQLTSEFPADYSKQQTLNVHFSDDRLRSP